MLFQKIKILSVITVMALVTVYTSPARAEIVVAVVGAMSGQFVNVGNEFKEGVKGAVEQINAAGGILGEQVKVIIGDDNCDPEKAISVAQEIVDQKASLVVGHLCSGASIAASEVYEKNGVVQISPASTSPKYTDRGFKNLFRTCGRDDMQGFVLAEHLVRRYKTKNVGIVYDETVYSTELARLTRNFMTKFGKKESFFVSVPNETNDFSNILQKIKTLNVGVLLFPGYAKSVTQLLMQAEKQGVQFRLVGSDTLMNDDFMNMAGDLTEGVEISFPPDPSHDRRNRKLTKMFKNKGFNPEAFTFYSYAAVQVWAQAVEKAKSVKVSGVTTALRSNTFDTVLGEVTFDDKGDISQPGFVMYNFIDGEPDYIQ